MFSLKNSILVPLWNLTKTWYCCTTYLYVILCRRETSHVTNTWLKSPYRPVYLWWMSLLWPTLSDGLIWLERKRWLFNFKTRIFILIFCCRLVLLFHFDSLFLYSLRIQFTLTKYIKRVEPKLKTKLIIYTKRKSSKRVENRCSGIFHSDAFK